MKISRSNWIFRFAFLFRDTSPGLIDQVSLCKLFWMAIRNLLVVAAIVAAGTLLVMYRGEVFVVAKIFAILFALGIGAIAVICIAAVILAFFDKVVNLFADLLSRSINRVRYSDSAKLIKTYLKAKKEGICPMLEVVDG